MRHPRSLDDTWLAPRLRLVPAGAPRPVSRAASWVDGRLRSLVCEEARCRRALGNFAGAFRRRRAWIDLGFLSLGDWARERLGLSGSEVESAARVAAALARLPRVSAAFRRGGLSWTKVRMLAPVATGETEDHWIEVASSSTTRDLDEAIRKERSSEAAGAAKCERELALVREDDGTEADGEERVPLGVVVPGRVRVLFRKLVEIARRSLGGPAPLWQCLEAIAAEAISGPRVVEIPDAPPRKIDEAAAAAASDTRRAARRDPEDAAVAASGGRLAALRKADDAESAVSAARGDRSFSVTDMSDDLVASGCSRLSASEAAAAGDAREDRSPSTAGAPGDFSPSCSGGFFGPSAPDVGSSFTGTLEGLGTRGRDRDGSNAPGELLGLPPDLLADIGESGSPDFPEISSLTGGRGLATVDADPRALDAQMREVVRAMGALDWKLGRLLSVLFEKALHRELGYERKEDYVRDVLGISLRKAQGLIALDRAARKCVPLERAYRSGELSWVRALTILPVVREADRATAQAWVERAGQVTVRHLADEVAWALERSDLGVVQMRNGPPPLGAPLGSFSPKQLLADAQMRREMDTCRDPVPINCSGPASVVALFRAAVSAWTDPGEPRWRGLERMLLHVLEEWVRTAKHRDPVFERDWWRCSVPACSAMRALEDHHREFLSRGGTNDLWNRLATCFAHHHHGIHEGRIRASGKAPDAITWELGVGRGREPFLVFFGDVYADALADARADARAGVAARGEASPPGATCDAGYDGAASCPPAGEAAP